MRYRIEGTHSRSEGPFTLVASSAEEAQWQAEEAGITVTEVIPEGDEEPRLPSRALVQDDSYVLGNFYLTVGQVIAALGCVLALLTMVFKLASVAQVSGVFGIPVKDRVLLVLLILLEGFVYFCLSAALLVTFTRVKRYRRD
jgi:hypothetical protein